MTQRAPRTLEDIWADQEDFNRNFVRYEMLVDDQAKEIWIHRYLAALHDEADELIRKTNFKVHRLRRKPLNMPSIHEELVDIFKYWLSIAQVCGMDVSTFLDEYHRKSEVVRDKWNRELLRLQNETKVAVFDIDGVLSTYPHDFLGYVNKKLGTEYKVPSMTSYYISECFPISRVVEEDLKAQFLADGHMRELGSMADAPTVAQKLRRAGYVIAVTTGRPYSHHMHYDTATWLKSRDIPYDIIIWGEDKADIIHEELSPAAPAFIVEDKPSTIEKLKSRTYPVYVMAWPYNSRVAEVPGQIERISSLTEILSKQGVS